MLRPRAPSVRGVRFARLGRRCEITASEYMTTLLADYT